MVGVTVERTGESYRVTVSEGGSATSHEVTAAPSDIAQLGDGASAEEVLAASFRFLLDREPKESIMSRFDLTVISRYFPEYPSAIFEYL